MDELDEVLKNYFYAEQIAQRIKEILDEHLSQECAKNISTGDFSILPEPERLDGYLPAVIIENGGLGVESANEQLAIYYMLHQFSIWYFYPYSFETMEDVPLKAKQHLHQIANVLMNFKRLDGFEIKRSETEAGGLVLGSSIQQLAYDNAETKLFRALDLPMFIGRIDYQVDFRTYQGL